jgi:ubiquinone/menaquinone biosynthesis C-methylase UbiE
VSDRHDSGFLSDDRYVSDQYRDAQNLSARNDLHVRFSTNAYGWRRWLFDRLLEVGLPADAHILELGCGPGWLWHEALSRLPAGWSITLTDLSPGMVEQAWANLADSGRPFAFEQVDIQTIPYAEGRFDAVIANHMLYHVPDLPRALGEVQRVLRPGGWCFAATNGAEHMHELNDLLRPFGIPEFTTRPFSLENGADQLAPFFAGVALHRYADGLIVPEVEPVVAYIQSGMGRGLLSASDLDRLRTRIAHIVAEAGALHITKDSGLFVAWRA